MSKEVYFADMHCSHNNNKLAKIRRLLEKFPNRISQGDLTAIKIHFGELGNDSFISPVFAREAVNFIRAAGAKPFITDTNTLYSGSRHNAIDHITTATLHGFVQSVIDCPVIIADGLKSRNYRDVSLPDSAGDTILKKFHIAGDILDADSMIVMSHFKAHEMAGFGGAIKNLGMGCAPAAGKKDQHSTKQFVRHDQCVGCGVCQRICPEHAATVTNGKANINSEICIGCGECMANCPKHAIDIDWATEIIPFVKRLTEYAYASVADKSGKVIYINFLTNIVPDCDCCGLSDAPIVRDIGFLASDDPVALDKASFDLVNSQPGLSDTRLTENLQPGEDKFKGLRQFTEGQVQFEYGEQIGFGTTDYTLIRV